MGRRDPFANDDEIEELTRAFHEFEMSPDCGGLPDVELEGGDVFGNAHKRVDMRNDAAGITTMNEKLGAAIRRGHAKRRRLRAISDLQLLKV